MFENFNLGNGGDYHLQPTSPFAGKGKDSGRGCGQSKSGDFWRPMNCPTCGSQMGVVTPKQRQCANLLLSGLRAKEIASEMGLSIRTVKQHLKQLYLHYGIRNGVKYVKLAVALYYYERNPEKRIA